MEQIVQQSPQYTLKRDADRGAFLFVRAINRYGHIDVFVNEIETAFDRIVEDQNFGVIMDLRNAVGRHDPEFEKAAKEVQQKHLMRVPRVAFLFATTMGVLQAQRLLGAKMETGKFFLTVSVEDAWRFASIPSQTNAAPNQAQEKTADLVR